MLHLKWSGEKISTFHHYKKISPKIHTFLMALRKKNSIFVQNMKNWPWINSNFKTRNISISQFDISFLPDNFKFLSLLKIWIFEKRHYFKYFTYLIVRSNGWGSCICINNNSSRSHRSLQSSRLKCWPRSRRRCQPHLILYKNQSLKLPKPVQNLG